MDSGDWLLKNSFLCLANQCSCSFWSNRKIANNYWWFSIHFYHVLQIHRMSPKCKLWAVTYYFVVHVCSERTLDRHSAVSGYFKSLSKRIDLYHCKKISLHISINILVDYELHMLKAFNWTFSVGPNIFWMHPCYILSISFRHFL